MDEGGIYEDGSPEQIFEHPLKDKTRQFVQRLKVLELKAGTKEYDFRSVVREIEQYCRRNHVDIRLTYHIQLAYEELVHQLLMSRLNIPQVYVAIEYSAAEKKASMTARWDGPEPDDLEIFDDDPTFMMLNGITRNAAYERNDSEDHPNKVVIEIAH